jgi:hypothetical protein
MTLTGINTMARPCTYSTGYPFQGIVHLKFKKSSILIKFEFKNVQPVVYFKLEKGAPTCRDSASLFLKKKKALVFRVDGS